MVLSNHPPTHHALCTSSSYLTEGTAAKFQGLGNCVQKVEEVVIVVAEALTEHQAADHVGHSATQEEGRIKRCTWGKKVHSQNCALTEQILRIQKCHKRHFDLYIDMSSVLLKMIYQTQSDKVLYTESPFSCCRFCCCRLKISNPLFGTVYSTPSSAQVKLKSNALFPVYLSMCKDIECCIPDRYTNKAHPDVHSHSQTYYTYLRYRLCGPPDVCSPPGSTLPSPCVPFQSLGEL